MFVVVGHSVAFSNGTNEGAKPYVGPYSDTKGGAIEAWKNMAITNGESEDEIKRSADLLNLIEVDTLISQYGGEEVLIVVELESAT